MTWGPKQLERLLINSILSTKIETKIFAKTSLIAGNPGKKFPFCCEKLDGSSKYAVVEGQPCKTVSYWELRFCFS